MFLISIDTLRADHLSCYGYRAIRTPNIDSYAARGTRFLDADAQVPLTLPSHTSLFTSTYPFENGIEENAQPVPPQAVTLASVLQSQGYKTAAFVASVFLERQMGLDRGFDLYDSPFNFTAFSSLSGSMFLGATTRNPSMGRDRRAAPLVVRAAVQWLNANRGQPVFVFVHLYDLHKPYTLAGYDAELESVDRALGLFRKTLVESGWWDRSLVVLLSDHGESLGEHGEASHGYFIYESTLRVPLLFHWPAGSAPLPAEVSEPAALIDVAPTILDLLRAPAPDSFEGRSLLGEGTRRAIYAESLHSHDSFGWAPLRSLRAGALKYIEAPRPELYDLASDPGEHRNLIASQPAKARELGGELTKLRARFPPKHPPQPGIKASGAGALLGSLGYLAPGPAGKRPGPEPDPKDMFPVFQLYEAAIIALSEGRRDEAVADLRRVLVRDPHNALARRDLGGCYLDQGDYARAREALEQVAMAAPGDYVTEYELGVADERLGRLPEALGRLRTACRIAPEAVQCRRELEATERRIGK